MVERTQYREWDCPDCSVNGGQFIKSVFYFAGKIEPKSGYYRRNYSMQGTWWLCEKCALERGLIW